MSHVISAGGILYKKEDDHVFILMCQPKGSKRWVFPKGQVGDKHKNESIEDAALREVKEEAGAIGEIKAPLTPITFWYTWSSEKTQKTVHYFLMEYKDGDITQHDFEMSNVEWLPIDEIEGKLTYNGDKSVWHEAEKLIGEVA